MLDLMTKNGLNEVHQNSTVISTKTNDKNCISQTSDCSTAISINGLYYRHSCDSVDTLKNVSLSIESSSIFSLLGPSGCGKTTLLRCVLGLIRPRFGSINIFGLPLGHSDLDIPGPNVGYMPQEDALYEFLTIEQLLRYYGRIAQMDSQLLENRIIEIISILELPDKFQSISTLSGGQRRRVSFALALLHNPRLVILDEPTSGVDPVLREKMWQHLELISHQNGVTIIITTHYIEEARRSNTIGLMRKGQILVEDCPFKLMNKFAETTLEGVFLSICQNFDKFEPKVDQTKAPVPFKLASSKPKSLSNQVKIAYKIISALLWRFFIFEATNLLTIGFQYIVPVFQILLFAFCIGGQPLEVPINVVNWDNGSISSAFIDQLDPRWIRTIDTNDIGSALEDAYNIRSWGVLTFHPGFSESFVYRLIDPENFSPEFNERSQITLHADLSRRVVTNSIVNYMETALVSFVRSQVTKSGQLEPTNFVAHPPIQIVEIIYGSYFGPWISRLLPNTESLNFRDYMFPGLVASMTYSIVYSLTGLSLITERISSTYERNLVSGVAPAHLLISLAFARIFFAIPYLFLVTWLPIYIFGFPISLTAMLNAIPILLTISVVGIAYGIFLSAMITSIAVGAAAAAATLFATMFISGTLWPLKSVPYYCSWAIRLAPTTAATETLRNILYKDWRYNEPSNLMAYIVTFSWAIVLFLYGVRFFRVS